MMTRSELERNQVWLYVVMMIVAVVFGLLFPGSAVRLESVTSIVIGLLLFSMFSQIPFTSMKKAFRNAAFIKALLVLNFMIVPIVVWVLSQMLTGNTTLLIGFYLVLLTPCIDYVIVFTALGRGDEKLVLVSTPILFVVQMLLLPMYLWLFMGRDALAIVEPLPFIEAFLYLVIIPLGIAVLLQLGAKRITFLTKVSSSSAWLPVPLMALTLFIVVASQIVKLETYLNYILQVLPLYIIFMGIMPFLAKYVAAWFRLEASAGRALIFSGATRNSLVVLPLALSFPDNGDVVAAVIITQTIVELLSELVYIRLVPSIIIRD
ncbi:arsenic resistance protein [Pontibacillus salicampi]|uniref:Arsenic resistance protein n=1 Tax=Pontibacillus salicampi TaxID=1449801 RepID=A0ABV6LKU6_9BACI